jgi:hypothetical protein
MPEEEADKANVEEERPEVHYYFPVEVVLVGDVGEDARREIEARIWDSLHQAMS